MKSIMRSISRYHVLFKANDGEPVYIGDTVYLHGIGRAKVEYSPMRLAIMFHTKIGSLYYSKVFGLVSRVIYHED